MPRLDFQKIAEEREDFTVVLVSGEEVTLPKVVPANRLLSLLAGRSREDLQNLGDEDKNNFGNELLSAIVGKENWQKILDGIGVDNIRPFTDTVYEYYGLSGNQEAQASEAEGEEGKAAELENQSQSTTSSSTSEHLTPTSNGFTPGLGKDSTGEPSTGTFSSPELDTSQENPSS